MKIPNHLSAEAKRYWKNLEECFELEEGLFILLKVRKEIKGRGMIIAHPETGFLRENPALKIEKEARSGFLQAWRQLGIETDVKEVGRPTDDRELKWKRELNVVKKQ